MFNCFIELTIEAKNWPSGRYSEETTEKKYKHWPEKNEHIKKRYMYSYNEFLLEIDNCLSLFSFLICTLNSLLHTRVRRYTSPSSFLLLCVCPFINFRVFFKSTEWIQSLEKYRNFLLFFFFFFMVKWSSLWHIWKRTWW